MNDLQTRQVTHSQGFRPQYEAEAVSAELAKMLTLVAPITMSTDQQTLWLASAVDALRDIRASEVAAVSTEVRRSITRPSQIVPDLAKLVAARREQERERSRRDAEDRALMAALPAKKHIADRDRRNFVAADWAELNEHLERMGSKARYGPDGTRYFPEESASG